MREAGSKLSYPSTVTAFQFPTKALFKHTRTERASLCKAVLPTLADLPDAFYRAAVGAERVYDAVLVRGITYVLVSVCV